MRFRGERHTADLGGHRAERDDYDHQPHTPALSATGSEVESSDALRSGALRYCHVRLHQTRKHDGEETIARAPEKGPRCGRGQTRQTRSGTRGGGRLAAHNGRSSSDVPSRPRGLFPPHVPETDRARKRLQGSHRLRRHSRYPGGEGDHQPGRRRSRHRNGRRRHPDARRARGHARALGPPLGVRGRPRRVQQVRDRADLDGLDRGPGKRGGERVPERAREEPEGAPARGLAPAQPAHGDRRSRCRRPHRGRGGGLPARGRGTQLLRGRSHGPGRSRGDGSGRSPGQIGYHRRNGLLPQAPDCRAQVLEPRRRDRTRRGSRTARVRSRAADRPKAALQGAADQVRSGNV